MGGTFGRLAAAGRAADASAVPKTTRETVPQSLSGEDKSVFSFRFHLGVSMEVLLTALACKLGSP